MISTGSSNRRRRTLSRCLDEGCRRYERLVSAALKDKSFPALALHVVEQRGFGRSGVGGISTMIGRGVQRRYARSGRRMVGVRCRLESQ